MLQTQWVDIIFNIFKNETENLNILCDLRILCTKALWNKTISGMLAALLALQSDLSTLYNTVGPSGYSELEFVNLTF